MPLHISTKEKFHTIHIQSENFTNELANRLKQMHALILQSSVKNTIVNFKNVIDADAKALAVLPSLLMSSTEVHTSFVICELSEPLIALLNQNDWIDALNITPTESEAWDIVQMEEMERELLDESF